MPGGPLPTIRSVEILFGSRKIEDGVAKSMSRGRSSTRVFYGLDLGFQFRMTVMGEALASSGTELITKDWPSGATI